MGSAPLLTIGLPVYNGARYLEGAVSSILSQSVVDLELIISDNASTDATESIGRAVAARDPRVTYRRNARNIGLAGNFNLLVPLARGRLFKWATADDALRPGYLERCVAAIDCNPSVVLAHTKTTFVDGSGSALDLVDPGWHLVADDPSERLLRAIVAADFVNAILGVVRIDALRRTRLLPSYAGGDYRLMAELSLQGKFVEDEQHLYVRRIHQGSSKGNADDPRWLRGYWGGSQPGKRAPYWHLCRDHAGIVASAPIPRARKIALLGQLARTMASRRGRLVGEVIEVVWG